MCLMIIAGQSEEVPTSEDVNETLTEGEEVSKVRFLLEKNLANVTTLNSKTKTA